MGPNDENARIMPSPYIGQKCTLSQCGERHQASVTAMKCKASRGPKATLAHACTCSWAVYLAKCMIPRVVVEENHCNAHVTMKFPLQP